ncbi:phosphatase PAP2 family protein [Streptomyces paludis]|uniref:Phosphatase PAP2 family protein n=1 Tax=Streptomyces paludis TaxID=2282738 RepID=A0A345HTD1_9ACTN|nr:phosphatase PAP2 family protein [Streptomyces paludis]AXG79955.1 phosphatase PAP2 family protein [Streptomyces paludis]
MTTLPPAGPDTLGRRGFLLRSAGVSAALVTAPTVLTWLTHPTTAAAAPLTGAAPAANSAASATAARTAAFVDSYTTNTVANLTPETNAVVRILGGMADVWKTGDAWNTGTPLQPDVLRANMRYCARITRARTDAQARQAFIYDRQDQSYAAIGGLGPLAELYRAGAKAVTSITAAPDTVPDTKINDAVPAGAPAGSAIGAGSPDSELGKVVELVNTLRGPSASSNPSKFAYQYPRPWRMTEDSKVVDTGRTDDLGYPVYRSDVVVVPQLLRQRSSTPTEDGGYPSGHTNAFYLACLALAYAVPERFQELVARASELSHSRIVAGMHSTVDVISGRTMATALAAAALSDPRNADLKSAAVQQAAAYFRARTGSTADTLYATAHAAGTATDPYADRAANAAAVTPRLTYVLPRRHGRARPMTVPKGAEVLLETRLPYLDAAQRREVLRTTALPSGYVLLDGSELWGRLDLFAAADGYAAFDRDVRVTLDAAGGGFRAADTWRNDIDGGGGLTKRGTGALTLTGANRYTGGTVVQEGTLTAASPHALGRGDVQVRGGTLRTASANGGVQIRRGYTQSAGTILEITPGASHRDPALVVAHEAVLSRGSALVINLDAEQAATAAGARTGLKDRTVPVIGARKLRGRFDTVTVTAKGYRAEPVYTANGLSVRLTRR